MPCPKCKSNNITLGGKYTVKRTRIKIQRFRCKDCDHSFVRRTNTYKQRIPLKIRKKIIELSKIKSYHKSKFDNSQKRTHSTREIARKLDVSKSFVHDVIKENNNGFKHG